MRKVKYDYWRIFIIEETADRDLTQVEKDANAQGYVQVNWTKERVGFASGKKTRGDQWSKFWSEACRKVDEINKLPNKRATLHEEKYFLGELVSTTEILK
jgi:hypothetical protein